MALRLGQPYSVIEQMPACDFDRWALFFDREAERQPRPGNSRPAPKMFTTVYEIETMLREIAGA